MNETMNTDKSTEEEESCNNGDNPVHPQYADDANRWPLEYGLGGLTKREYFAAQMMPALYLSLVQSGAAKGDWANEIAFEAKEAADAYFKL